MGEVIQLQGDQRKDVQDFLTDTKGGLELDAKTIKVRQLVTLFHRAAANMYYRSTVSKPIHLNALSLPICEDQPQKCAQT